VVSFLVDLECFSWRLRVEAAPKPKGMIIIVVLLLLFCIQILIIKHKESGENQDFTALEIVSACGAFLFIVIIDQINLRQKIITAGIIYFDYSGSHTCVAHLNLC